MPLNMRRHRRISGVIALAILGLLLALQSRLSHTASAETLACCCVAPPAGTHTDTHADTQTDTDTGCRSCCGDGIADPAAPIPAPRAPCPCDDDVGGQPIAPFTAALGQAGARVESATFGTVLPAELRDSWIAPVPQRARTGPPVYLRHCVFLI